MSKSWPLSRASRPRTALARWVYLGALSVIVGWLLIERWDVFMDLFRRVQVISLGIVLLLLLGQLFIGAWFWRTALRSVGERPPFLDVLRATCRAAIARHLPGGVWHGAGRIALLSRRGLPLDKLALVWVLELGMSLTTIAVLGPLLASWGGVFLTAAVEWIAVCGLVLLMVSLPLLNFGLACFARRRDVRPVRISTGRYCQLLLLMVLFWAWSSVAFIVYVDAFQELVTATAIGIAGAFMLAWGAGFLVLVAPQGIGVFEATIALLLAQASVAEVALAIGGYRLIGVVRDLVAPLFVELVPAVSATGQSEP